MTQFLLKIILAFGLENLAKVKPVVMATNKIPKRALNYVKPIYPYKYWQEKDDHNQWSNWSENQRQKHPKKIRDQR